MRSTHRLRSGFALLAALALLAGASAVRANAPPVTTEIVHPGLDMPTTIRFAPDGRLFCTTLLNGQVLTFASDTTSTPRLWAQLPPYDVGERGMMGMAFHPDFPDSPWVYVYQTVDFGAGPYNRIVRLADSSGVGVRMQMIRDSLPGYAVIHNGGRMAFGPDRMLYVTIGDQMVASSAHDAQDVRGKILRLTPLGRPAPGNPWGATNPAFVKGVRNPYGLCFDPVTGAGFFSENGPACDDELDLLTAAADYGWDTLYVCHVVPPGTQAPMWSFTPTRGLTGCTVYRGSRFPSMNGNLLVACVNDGNIRRAVLRAGQPGIVDTLEVLTLIPDAVTLDVTTGPNGLIYVSTYGDIRRIVPATNLSAGPGPGAAAFGLAPNPSRRTVTFTLPAGGAYDRVEIADLAGRRVRAWSGVRGTLTWDGRDERGARLPHGVYFVRASGPGGTATRRLVRLDP